MARRQPWWRIFLKGIAMGLCDVVPGISGGTIALIAGIYQRLIDAISGTLDLCKACISGGWRKRKQFKKTVKAADLPFLGILFGGILLAVLLGSKLILYLLDQHFTYTISFFVGLIIASAILITRHIEEHSLPNIATLVLGIALGLSFLLYAPLTTTPTILYLLLSGFLAVSALFLPGISGSFILLLLGVYEYLLALLHDAFRRPGELLVFIVGAVLGAAFISKLVKKLFTINKSRTLYGLLGIVIGSLGIPLRRIFLTGAPSVVGSVLFAAIGFFTILLIERQAP